jgi:hypothetical protein
MKKNKNKKVNSIILKSFIAIAIVIMLLTIMPGEAYIKMEVKT